MNQVVFAQQHYVDILLVKNRLINSFHYGRDEINHHEKKTSEAMQLPPFHYW